MTIFDKILENKKREVARLKIDFTIKYFEKSPFYSMNPVSLKAAITKQSFGIIAEIKRKSPSAGKIRTITDPAALAQQYEKAGITGVSVLTDSSFFGGSIEDMIEVKKSISIPVLRKEFIIDEIQLFQAKAGGADAVLLIAEALSEKEALHLTILAQNLGLEVLMEFHERNQLHKINEEVDIIGVNNRSLVLQETDISTSLQLFDFLPRNMVLISESGIQTKQQLMEIMNCGYHGALIGESILKNHAPAEFISELVQGKEPYYSIES
jgi:indole-3-glycerol phosphate synthase